MQLGTYIMASDPILTVYFIKFSHRSVCLYVYPFIVARQKIAKNVTLATNTLTIEELLGAFSMQSMSYLRKVAH
jgi:hypothetical protein